MIDFDNQTDTEVNFEIFDSVAQALTQGDIELLIVGDEEIKQLNLQHRKIDKSTDVLSFPINDPSGKFLGSIVISVETAKRVADEMEHGVEDELKLLFLHGVLHLLGFDHETDEGQMRQKENEIAVSLGLESSMLERSEA
jgi:probable rRNA maturation factor